MYLDYQAFDGFDDPGLFKRLNHPVAAVLTQKKTSASFHTGWGWAGQHESVPSSSALLRNCFTLYFGHIGGMQYHGTYKIIAEF